MRMFKLLVSLCLLVAVPNAFCAPCTPEDFESHVSGSSQCLLMRRFGLTEPETMVVWLHGDVSSGGPANYHFAVAQSAAAHFASARVVSIALVRPGYPDGSGESSTVAPLSGGRTDHYTLENLEEVGVAIERLRAHFKPKFVVAVGHSGGAATAAVLLGMKPGLLDAAVLVACPCELVAWRANRPGARQWTSSENPRAWADKVSTASQVIALTGAKDDNTQPDLARGYVNALQARGVEARFALLPDESHNSAFRSPQVIRALTDLLAGRPAP